MIESALEQLRSGKPILIFDGEGREGETDMVIPSQFATQETITRLRTDGGGLLCVTIRETDARKLGLFFFDSFFRDLGIVDRNLFFNGDLRYDSSSPFSLPINHRSTFTGIPDIDRSKTVTSFAGLIGNLPSYNGNAKDQFAKEFRSPGHVWIIISREGYFQSRRGHTELSTYMVETAGLIPSAAIVEMLSPNGHSLTKEEAMKYASDNSLVFIEGKDIVAAWRNGTGNGYRSL